MRYLVTGGVKSGKSSRALQLARLEFTRPGIFIATAEVLDDEMRARVAAHRGERLLSDGSPEFLTVEEPLEIHRIAVRYPGQSAILDCVTLWVNNLVHYRRESDFSFILDAFIATLPEECVIVTNETALGNIPFDELTRRYNLLLAEANRRLAAAVDRVDLMVSGIPVRVK